MANLTYVKTAIIGFNLYAVAVNGTVIPGETYTVNSTLGILCQYTAVPGDDNNSVAIALKALINSSYTSGVTSTPPAFAFKLPRPNEVTSTPTTSPPPPPTPQPPVVVTSTGANVTYGRRFQVSFDPPNGGSAFFKPRYRLDILQKNYSGTVTSLTGGPSGFKQSWQTDEPKPPIKGCSLIAGILNDGSLPLKTFYSVDDDEFKLQLYWLEVGLLIHATDRLLFEGFLVQDDCSEQMVDYLHELSLSANDGLGLLKGVSIDKAPASYEIFSSSSQTYEITITGIDSDVLVSTDFGNTLQTGDKLSIDGSTLYTIKDLIQGSGIWNVDLVEHPAAVSSTTGTIIVYRSSLIEKITLLSVIKRCLSSTGLNIETHIYCNLLEANHLHTFSFLEQTLIDGKSFLKNDTEYVDCYTALEWLLNKFNLTLFQSDGVWNIVRWHELIYYSNNIPGFAYDKDFNLIGPVTLPDALQIDAYDPLSIPEAYPETGLINRIFRPDLFVKETFNYKSPAHLLRNDNLDILGPLIRTYTTGSGSSLQKISEYKMPWWHDEPGDAMAVFFIRIVKDQYDNEIERYAVVKNDSIVSYAIEASKGDLLSLSFSVRVMYLTGGNNRIVAFPIELTDGIQTVFVQKLPSNLPPLGEKQTVWDSGLWYYEYPTGEYQGQWTDINIATTLPIPFDGKLSITLTQFQKNPFNNIEIETHYKDIRFTYTALINESTKIIGHTHKAEQAATIKQNEDEEIFVDDSPRNFIAGTLFLNRPPVGAIQERTSLWYRFTSPAERKKLGQITTREQLQWRSKARTILEGSFIGLLHENGHRHVSMLSVFRSSLTPELNFVPGKLELDFKNDMFNCTLWEMNKDGEPDIESDYQFKYLYDTK